MICFLFSVNWNLCLFNLTLNINDQQWYGTADVCQLSLQCAMLYPFDKIKS